MEFGSVTAAGVDTCKRYDYKSGLKRLHTASLSGNELSIIKAVCNEMALVSAPESTLFQLTNTCDGRLSRDGYSTALLYRCFPGSQFTAAQTTGDGSCLFNAASLLICG